MIDQVQLVFQLDDDEEWCVDSVHATSASVKERMDKLAKEGDYDADDIEKYLDVQDFAVLGKIANV